MSSQAELKNEALESSGAPLSSYRWVIAAGVVISNWSLVIPSLSFGILLPEIRTSFPMTDTQAGWLSSSARIGNVLLAIASVFIFARTNPLKLLRTTIFLGAGFTFMMAAAMNFWMMAVARLAFGASFSARTPSRPLLSQQWFPLREIPVLNGIVIGLTSLAEFFALAATPFILAWVGNWRTTLSIYGAFVSAVFLAWMVLGKERITPDYLKKAAAPNKFGVRGVWRYKQLWFMGFGGFAAAFGWWAFATFWPTYMRDAHGIPLKESGVLFGLISLAQAPASIVAGVIAMRVKDRRPILVACGIGMTGSLIGMTLVTETWALALLGIVGGVSWCYMPIMFSMPYEIPGIDLMSVSAGTALMTTILTTGAIIGPIAAGSISDTTHSLFIALIVCGCVPILMALFSLPVRPYRRPVQAST